MAQILCIESSTQNCSVALTKGKNAIELREGVGELNHAECLASYCQELLTNNGLSVSDLDAVAVSRGPGSYTGLRIGYSFVKGLCYALNIPMITVDTLYIMATAIRDRVGEQKNTCFVPMIDARRMEVYMCVYDHNLQLLENVRPVVLNDSDTLTFFSQQSRMMFCAGSGSCKFHSLVKERNLPITFSDASHNATNLAQAALKHYDQQKFDNVAYAVPFYLKNFVATTPKKK